MLTLISWLLFKIFKTLTAISAPKGTCWNSICLLGVTRLARRNSSAFNCRMYSHRIIESQNLSLCPAQPAPELDNPCH